MWGTAEGDEQTLKEIRVSEDWVQFALDRPVCWEPGKQSVYCSPAIHLLSPILEKATGMSPQDMAKLGYLWLHGGALDGKQIVSRAWVEDVFKPHMPASDDETYGYGSSLPAVTSRHGQLA